MLTVFLERFLISLWAQKKKYKGHKNKRNYVNCIWLRLFPLISLCTFVIYIRNTMS